MLQRERNRTPQLTLLDDVEIVEPVTEQKNARSSILEAARIHLLHGYDLSYYYGMDKLADASNNNIEQFIRLSGVLVEQLLARTVLGKKPELTAKSQHEALVGQANKIMAEWDFPYHLMVKKLINEIADRCVTKTLEPNAPLEGGANAIGVPQADLQKILARSERLTRVLHFAFAYKALIFVPEYSCKGKAWCLLELGAIPCISHNLTLRRGGFIEGSLSDLNDWIGE